MDATNDLFVVVDARERAVIPFLESALTDHAYVVRQITTGDFHVCRRGAAGADAAVLACIERKTLDDFAASFKDGRLANVQKMRDLRLATACQLYFFVEGPAFPSPTRRFARIPYANIEAAVTKLMTHDGVFVIQTADASHTAKRIADLVRSFGRRPAAGAPPGVDVVLQCADTLQRSPQQTAGGVLSVTNAPAGAGVRGLSPFTLNTGIAELAPNPLKGLCFTRSPEEPSDIDALRAYFTDAVSMPCHNAFMGDIPGVADALRAAGGASEALRAASEAIRAAAEPAPEAAPRGYDVPGLLTAAHTPDDNTCVIKMWQELPGVTLMLGAVLTGLFSIGDLASGRATHRLPSLRTATGRPADRRAVASLAAVAAGDRGAHIRLLAGIHGISGGTAAAVLAAVGGLAALSRASVDDVAAIAVPRGTGTARFGPARAERCIRLVQFTRAH